VAVYPNNIRTASGWNPYRNTGASPTLYDSKPTPGSRRCRYVADSTAARFPKTYAQPPGGAPFGALIQPYTAGGMSGTSTIRVTGSGNARAGRLMSGTATISLLPTSGALKLVVGLSGTAVLSLLPVSVSLKLTIKLSGSGACSLTGSGALAMRLPFSGTGAFGITGSANLKGRLTMSGSWGGAAVLSPEGLAAAVWNSNAASFALAGTMGEKLNTAGSGGLSPTQATQLEELHKIHGLESGTPLQVSSVARVAGGVTQNIVESPPGVVTVSRA